MRGPPLARIPAVAAPRTQAAQGTTSFQTSFDSRFLLLLGADPTLVRALSYRKPNCETPLHGIDRLMPAPQACIPSGRLSGGWLFPIIGRKDEGGIRQINQDGERRVGE